MSQAKIWKDEKGEMVCRYLVVGYLEDQAGQPIKDEDVTRPRNHRWTEQGSDEVKEFGLKNTDRAPTYGLADKEHC
jgi:hypothetical protein